MAALAALCSPRVLSQQQGPGSAPAHSPLRGQAHAAVAAHRRTPTGTPRREHSSSSSSSSRARATTPGDGFKGSPVRSAPRRALRGTAPGQTAHREGQSCSAAAPGAQSAQSRSHLPCPAPGVRTPHCAPAPQCALGSRDSVGSRGRGLQGGAVLAGPPRQASSPALASGGLPSSSSSSDSRVVRRAARCSAFSQTVHTTGDCSSRGTLSPSLERFPLLSHPSTQEPATRRQRAIQSSGDSAASSSPQQHPDAPSQHQAQLQGEPHTAAIAETRTAAQGPDPSTAATGAESSAAAEGAKRPLGAPANGSMGYSDGQGSGAAYVFRRVLWGAGIGASAFSAILRGEWAFALLLGLLCGVGCWEYQGLVRRRCALRGLRAPSLGAAAVTSLACGLMPPITLAFGGQVKMALATGAAAVAAVLLLQPTRPRLSEISSLSFGSLYCGFLATYWVKLRCEALPAAVLAAVPWPPPPGTVSSLQAFLVRWWPSLLGGGAQVVAQPEKWTLGLAATFLAFAGIIAADTGAYVGGKLMGRTPLINISPNKTWEGALSGLCSCILVSLWVARSLMWPTPPFWTGVLATCVFLAALFGDLSESMLKRDAGVKDAGRLIPGHGGVLDRTDSYVFTGLTVFAFVRFVLPLLAAS